MGPLSQESRAPSSRAEGATVGVEPTGRDGLLPRRAARGLTLVAARLGALALLGSAASRQEAAGPGARSPLAPAGVVELPGVEGRIDHLAVDLARERLFVAALGNDSVEVIDLRAGKVQRSLPGSEPQGILYLADCDRLVVANGRSGTCDVYAGDTLELGARVEVGDDADNLRYDAGTKRLYVAYGDGALGIVDGATWQILGKIPLAAHPESFQLDAQGKRAFVNLPGARQLALVDLEHRSVLQSWPIEEAQANFPMAWVPAGSAAPEGLLLLGCRSPAKLLLRSASNGAALGALELSGDADDIFHDAARERVYVACGAGFVDVFERDEHAGLRALAKVPTASGARTCLFVPERKQLFLAVPRRESRRAELRIFTVQD